MEPLVEIDAETFAKISTLLARDEILQVMHRHTRGFDRFDRPLMLSAYHSDAVLTSGFFTGSAEAYLDLALKYHEEHEASHNMMHTNFICEIDGDQAHTEVYWIQASVARTTGESRLIGGRFIDRWERREGRWGIVLRSAVAEWSGILNSMASASPGQPSAPTRRIGTPARDFTDPSYQRPLTLDGDLRS